MADEEVAGAKCFILVETSGGRREHDEAVCSVLVALNYLIIIFSQKLNDLLESLLSADKPLVTTGVLSQSPAQFSSLWALREGIPEAASKEGKAVYKYDISIPVSSFKEVVDDLREHLRLKGLLHVKAVKHVLGYGHVGDGMSAIDNKDGLLRI